MRDQLTDEMLTQAAKQVAESMKASLPVPKECHHEFPPEFERDMKRLAAQTERRRHMRRYLQRVAAACLAVVISLSTWLAVDAEARAAFVQWVKTVYEQSVVYEFFHSGEAQNEAGYMLGWVQKENSTCPKTALNLIAWCGLMEKTIFCFLSLVS